MSALPASLHTVVIAGLDPAIHPLRKNMQKGWTPGSSPGVTERASAP
jgi:hypothetical protein